MTVVLSPFALADIDEKYEYYWLEYRHPVAEDFLLATYKARVELAEAPSLGPPFLEGSAALRDIRFWRVPIFDRIKLYYPVEADTIYVLRVLDGSQDPKRQLRNSL